MLPHDDMGMSPGKRVSHFTVRGLIRARVQTLASSSYIQYRQKMQSKTLYMETLAKIKQSNLTLTKCKGQRDDTQKGDRAKTV